MVDQATHHHDEPEIVRLVVWPHRSLDRRGLILLIAAVSVGMGCALAKPLLHGAWPVAIPVIASFAGFLLALRANMRSARHNEIIEITPRTVRVRSERERMPSKETEFNTYWTRVSVSTDRYAENRILLHQSGRSLEIGAFLSPDERVELAEKLKASIAAAKSCSHVD